MMAMWVNRPTNQGGTYNTYTLPVGAFDECRARLDLRLSTKDRERIDRAAALAGLPLAHSCARRYCAKRIECGG